jgi:hypothetical protein
LGDEQNDHYSLETIYIPLVDEGTTVSRPTLAVPLGNDLYRVLATPDYDPADEHWKFPPGSVVRCISRSEDGTPILIAHEKDDTGRISSEFLAALIIDALIDANIIKKTDLKRAIEIAMEEIDVRKAAGDY